jgi:N-methylhydantoinase B
MAALDVNEGVVPLIEMRFPPTGTLLTPVFPGADQRPHLS